MNNQNIGFGSQTHEIAVYIANKPPLPQYQHLEQLTPLTKGEITYIGNECGNGWRKVFNVYAKLLYALNQQKFNFSNLAPTWQQYRDNFLLQANSKTALLFGPPSTNSSPTISQQNVIHIIMGRTYAKSLISTQALNVDLTWLNHEFAINQSQRIIVCPYFDYRQLSNIKIQYLAELINTLN